MVELPDGRSLTVETVPLRPAGKEESQTLFVMRDETERRKTEAVRRDFVANASHELKTPLAGLSLLADTLAVALHDDADRATQCVDQLRSETQRLTNLTNDLLTLSRLEESQSSEGAVRDAVDLAALARDTAEELRPLAVAKQQELDVEAPDELDADRRRGGPGHAHPQPAGQRHPLHRRGRSHRPARPHRRGRSR